jgi:hypothetical protein
MIDKGELEKVALAGDLLLVLQAMSTKDQIDVLQLALETIQDGKGNASRHIRTWAIRSETRQEVTYLVTLKGAAFFCSCPAFKKGHRECKHIKKVKMMLAGEKQKNKLPGVKT